ncbi:hypothetical protein IWW36_001968 [Coemansia brasiliensis]|uniref:HNH domain-containing protein n=1 Tax=Coemansia brasiliensis TaxID=2650707 RepID=A0A9W8IGU3_9FUNG|nr:hypothetical protein IWW36_001968 [Coemansia brasiliensis]
MADHTNNRLKMLPRDKAIYSNCRVLDINGDLLFRAGHRRLEWYLSRNLAHRIDDNTIQLNFVNKGHGRKNEPFYLQDMQNNCTICGTTGSLTMHHVVPSQYRTFMEESIKSRSSHDLLPVCTICHDRYERHAVKFKKHLAQCFKAPLDGVGWIERKDIGKGGRAAATLISPSLANIPAERVSQLQSIVDQVVSQNIPLFSDEIQLTISQCQDNGKRLCDEQSILNELISMQVRIRGPEFRTHGEIVVDSVASRSASDSTCEECKKLAAGGVPALISAWRRHFVDNAQPAYLPDHWSVTYPCLQP